MSRKGCRRRSGAVVVIAGIGQVMIWAAIIPVLVVWWLVKALAILALAVHDVIRYRQHPATVALVRRTPNSR
jgi:hypothetical protein